VIDNSEGNSDTRKVAHDYEARYILEPAPGLCRARNRALAECDTDLIVFLDDDVMPSPDWLLHMVEPFRNERTAASSGRVVTDEQFLSEPSHQNPRTLSNQDSHWFEIAAFGGIGLGASMAFRKPACASEQFFDERLGRGAPFEMGDESYAFTWLLSRGLVVAYVPSAIVHQQPLARAAIEPEARHSFSYWLLLFSKFPAQRLNLLHFLVARLRGSKLEWLRNPQDPVKTASSGWRFEFQAALYGLSLFLRTPKPR